MSPALVKAAIDKNAGLVAYPVGSIYMSVNSTDPSILFGGTWEQLKDMFLLAAGDTYSAGSTGGEAAHMLTVDEMPSHTHQAYLRHTSTNSDRGDYFRAASGDSQGGTGITYATGGDQSHNNMPPYLAVYVWKRVA